jgi:hypothetical protein
MRQPAGKQVSAGFSFLNVLENTCIVGQPAAIACIFTVDL